MTESVTSTSSVAAVPHDEHTVSLIDSSGVKSKLGPVGKFNGGDNTSQDVVLHPAPSGQLQQVASDDEDVQVDDLTGYKKPKTVNQFTGMSKEELKAYINDPYWKRIRWIIAIAYIVLLIALLIGSILLVFLSPRCPPKPNLAWYQREVIYEINVPYFRDADGNGIGDIKGIQEKLPYLEKNNIKSILLQSSIFNASGGSSLPLTNGYLRGKRTNLLNTDPLIGNENDLQDLTKNLNQKNMHLIVDLPLASTDDPNGLSWYGSNSSLGTQIQNPCFTSKSSLGCRYNTFYGRLPLDFSQDEVKHQAEDRLRHWLSTKKLDGVRVDVPLAFNRSTNSYSVSLNTIDAWISITQGIAKKTKPKLIVFDIPADFHDIVTNDSLYQRSTFPILLFNDRPHSRVTAQQLHEQTDSRAEKKLPVPKFWQFGSLRRSDSRSAIDDDNALAREMRLTMAMLMGGTPIVLYGEEIALDQKSSPLMAWTPDPPYGGFSSCSSGDCSKQLSWYSSSLSETSVKRQEALGGRSKDSLLTLFRRLAKLREQDSFQFGTLETGYYRQSDIFWFIREAPGHRGYVVLLDLEQNKNNIAHLSLSDLTDNQVPEHIHYEYQWPDVHLKTTNSTHFNSDNLLIHPRSINIFWWTPKVIRPNVLLQSKKHSQSTA